MGVVHIIDDDHIYREVIVEIIQTLGFSTRDFSSGSSYLHYVGQDKYILPKAIFSDMDMPGIDGLAMLHKVLHCYPGIPCYLVTGDPDQFGRLELSESAVREVLRKPVNPGKIKSILQSLS